MLKHSNLWCTYNSLLRNRTLCYLWAFLAILEHNLTCFLSCTRFWNKLLQMLQWRYLCSCRLVIEFNFLSHLLHWKSCFKGRCTFLLSTYWDNSVRLKPWSFLLAAIGSTSIITFVWDSSLWSVISSFELKVLSHRSHT